MFRKGLDWYDDVERQEFDIHRYNMNASEKELYDFVHKKYPFESMTSGYKYLSYNSRRIVEETLWSYTVVEAIAVCQPLPASKKNPKLIEPGRLVRVIGFEKSKRVVILLLIALLIRLLF